jgi:hypothetical protein
MGMLNLKVSDISGSRINDVEAPDDVPINRILVVLVERMNLPLNSPDGQLMSYKLHHRRAGTQLLDTQTLAQAHVLNGDELRLQPEITAGGPSLEGNVKIVARAERSERLRITLEKLGLYTSVGTAHRTLTPAYHRLVPRSH